MPKEMEEESSTEKSPAGEGDAPMGPVQEIMSSLFSSVRRGSAFLCPRSYSDGKRQTKKTLESTGGTLGLEEQRGAGD